MTSTDMLLFLAVMATGHLTHANTMGGLQADSTKSIVRSNTHGTPLIAAQRRSDLQLPSVSRSLLVSNGLIFALTLQRPGLISLFAKDDAFLRRSRWQYYRLITSCFLHASIPHIVVNSASLNSLGPAVEEWFGSDRTLALYLVSGAAGNLLSYVVGRSPLAVGASGAIFGLLGGWAVFLQRNEAYFASRGLNVRRSLRSIFQTCMLNAALGMPAGARIDNMGHLGGLIGGGTCAFFFGPRLRRVGRRTLDEPLVRIPVGPLDRRRHQRLYISRSSPPRT